MPDKIQNNDFLVMGFSEMPDRKPANVILSGIKKTRRPTGSASLASKNQYISGKSVIAYQ